MLGVNDDCYSHYYIQQQNTSIVNWRRSESTQWLTDDGSLRPGAKVRRLVNQLSWEGPVQNYIILTGISEQPDLKKVDLYHYRMDVYTHFKHKYMFKKLEQ